MASLTTRADQVERNLIINGNMDFAQRGTSFTGLTAAGNQFAADRFAYRPLGGGVTSVVSLAQSTDVPTLAQSGFQSRFSTILTVTGAQATYTGTSGITIGYVVEGQDYAQIHGKKARLQFWVKSSLVGVYSIGLENGSNTRSYTTTYTIAAANTWQKVILDVALDSAGTWAFDNTAGLSIYFVLAMGPTRQTGTLNTWQSTDTPASTNQVNLAATAGATFQLAQVMLIPQDFTQAGSATVDVPFHRAGLSIGHELQMCQRYYESSLDVTQSSFATGGAYYLTTTAAGAVTVKFSTTKRIAPSGGSTVRTYAENTGLADSVRDESATVDRSVTYHFANTTGFNFTIPTIPASNQFGFNWACDAEL